MSVTSASKEGRGRFCEVSVSWIRCVAADIWAESSRIRDGEDISRDEPNEKRI